MDQNKIRKLAGLPLLSEAKKKVDAPVDADVDGVPADAVPDGDADDDKTLPAIVSKIAASAMKKFGITDKDGEDTNLDAMQDFLSKVYAAGLKDGSK